MINKENLVFPKLKKKIGFPDFDVNLNKLSFLGSGEQIWTIRQKLLNFSINISESGLSLF